MSQRPFAFLLCAGILVLPAGAVADTGGTAREIWPQATASLDGGDVAGATKRVDQLLEGGKNLGVKRYPLYAISAASLARQENRKGNQPAAKWAMDTAERLDRKSPEVALTRADLAKDQGNWSGAVTSTAAGVGRIFGDYRARLLARTDLLTVVAGTLATLVAAYSLILFLRYRRQASHDLREVLHARFGGGGAITVLAFALLFFPLFLWLGPLWLVLYWLALFFPYATTRERLLSAVSLLILATIPPMLNWNASRMAGVDSPIVAAALASDGRSYEPGAMRRLRELQSVVPSEPSIHLLIGNLELQDGNEQEANVQYRKAVEANDELAGAWLNLGNLHFLNNDFGAAITNYEKAQTLAPTMAIAYYNHSVANGETYKFEEQGRNLAQAKKYDRTLIDSLTSAPTPQKIAMYQLPIAEAWRISERIARKPAAREVFGNFSSFDPANSLKNPLTIGAILAALAAAGLAFMKKRSNVAGECIKCGRTFCYRCKSSRDSATYCTQCIHIYLKRDGVSLDTKRSKLEEVQEFQSSSMRIRKIVSSFLPGAGQMMEGNTLRGLIPLALFLFFVWLAFSVGRLAPVMHPAETARLLLRSIAILLAAVTWAVTTIPAYRQRVTG
ncbi:MAG TPA: tetratricopeptide repeat protein [Thermoanaerobaculia bacterium]|nr:tetratricopeptide repeat protein [Thermoanaerobaculia bacterium]